MPNIHEGGFDRQRPRKPERWVTLGPNRKRSLRRKFQEEGSDAIPVEGIILSVQRAQALDPLFTNASLALFGDTTIPQYYHLVRFGEHPEAYHFGLSKPLYVGIDLLTTAASSADAMLTFARNRLSNPTEYVRARDQFVAVVNEQLTLGNLPPIPGYTTPSETLE